ncbi:(deoxy)nucleoside triphosphate pyrophosphohydrolase [Algoriphagus litoralis]|uniref:(deoxy)nucleoside triphosphate pyrophosphohydrolase n=1 Tax=Algoriphagus litoralis TaxID=2202829 RepID=UPI000DB9F927|nr:(deoxy)nucleoside triphosphate pyrophosphohydrolase [Algoriphagus litoralis]
MKIIPVTCAIIFHQGKVLAAKRSETMDLAGKWEFPGGKIEAGESPEACLIREIQEELAVKIQVVQALPSSDYVYSDEKTIRLIPFLAQLKSFDFHLLEHEELVWLGEHELFTLDWAAADVPIVHQIQDKWVKLVEEIKPMS